MTSSQSGVRVLVLRPDDERAHLEWLQRPAGASSLYEPLKALVGGYIEMAGLTSEAAMYLNEEGKLEGLAVNQAANLLFANGEHRFAVPGDYLVGPVVVVGLLNAQGEQDGDDHDLPQSVLDLCARVGIEVVDHSA